MALEKRATQEQEQQVLIKKDRNLERESVKKSKNTDQEVMMGLVGLAALFLVGVCLLSKSSKNAVKDENQVLAEVTRDKEPEEKKEEVKVAESENSIKKPFETLEEEVSRRRQSTKNKAEKEKIEETNLKSYVVHDSQDLELKRADNPQLQTNNLTFKKHYVELLQKIGDLAVHAHCLSEWQSSNPQGKAPECLALDEYSALCKEAYEKANNLEEVQQIDKEIKELTGNQVANETGLIVERAKYVTESLYRDLHKLDCQFLYQLTKLIEWQLSGIAEDKLWSIFRVGRQRKHAAYLDYSVPCMQKRLYFAVEDQRLENIILEAFDLACSCKEFELRGKGGIWKTSEDTEVK